ncbi:MAG TPA: SDR family NAD(P)-dependent oxidoreductase [Verrucomicrobiae bacterium]|jgi:NAD(P)-dependent dehydrogenase (short-subunit alcohol dehydrogenase family)|nr:SDR family NAD(P)-dependent oxidoreductase [Verrucomicrobiae bacterium]
MKKPVAFITGASRGIGRGIAIQLAKRGWDLAGLSRLFDPNNTASGLFEVKQRAEEVGANFLPLQGDVTSLADHEHIVQLLLEKYGRIDLLVNNAGVMPEKQLDILEVTGGSFDRVININLRGPFFLTQRIALQMSAQSKNGVERKPSIVFITSIAARVPSPARAEYCISKAGLSMAAAVFADRLAEHGINVYEVRPGASPAAADEKSPPELPESVGKAVAALVSESSAHSTGAVMEVNAPA